MFPRDLGRNSEAAPKLHLKTSLVLPNSELLTSGLHYERFLHDWVSVTHFGIFIALRVACISLDSTLR
jgi:hypothetical protein